MKTLPKCAGLLLIHANIAPPQVKVEEHAAAAAFRTRTYQHMHNLGQQNAEPCLPWSPGRNNHASPASVGPVREVSLGKKAECLPRSSKISTTSQNYLSQNETLVQYWIVLHVKAQQIGVFYLSGMG